MKKLLLVAMLLMVFLVALNAGTLRNIYQKVGCQAPNDVFTYVTNTGTTTSANYIVRVWMTERPTEILTTEVGQPGYTAPGALRLVKIPATPAYAAILVQIGTFTTQWASGNHLHYWVQHIATGEIAEFELVIPEGFGAYTENTVQIIPPAPVANTYTYNLTVNGPAGTTVTGPGTYAGTLPFTFICGPNNTDINDLIGNWTVPGTDWVVNPIAVTADMFVAAKTNYVYNATITFVPAPDVYNYTLHVTGPDGIAVTGPVNGTLDYDATDLDGTMENALLGVYTAGAAPAGFQWVTNPLTVTADMFTAAKSGAVLGSRNNGAKATYNYVATIEFVLEVEVIPDTWTYNLQVNGPDGYAVTGPVNGTTDYLAVDDDDNVNGLLGDYTIAAAPDGFHWAVNPITVTADMFAAAKVDHVYNATIEFVLVENVIDPTNPPMGVVVTPGGNNGMPGTDGGLPATIYTIAASGVWDVIVNKPAGFGYPWYAFINTIPMLASGPIMVDTYTFSNVNFGAKAPLVVTLDDDEALTLPVELSYFAATLTAQNFVKLTWVSQSETGLLGYRVYRSENNDQASAISITPSMIPATNTSTTQTYSITDAEVAIGSTYYYWLESVDMGHSTFFGPTSVLVQGEVPPVLPEYTTMRNAYPNPFRANTGTTIEVNVKAGETGQVTVYNVLGQVVKTYTVKEGLNNLNWNGKDSKGNVCGSGIYFYKLSTPSMNMTKKMVIVK